MIKFGTDGWRAIIADEFTFENVKRLAAAYAQFLKNKNNKKCAVAVGYDTRFLSREFAQTAATVLAQKGIKSYVFKSALPSPCLCFIIKKHKLSGGLMITASHNPPRFNGVKIKTNLGAPASEAETKKIEKIINNFKSEKVFFSDSLIKKGLLIEADFKQEYLDNLKKIIDFKFISGTKIRVLHDSMYGAGSNLLEEIFKKTVLKVTSIRSENNPSFNGISPEPIPRNLVLPIKLMQGKKYDICLVTDGDSDRIGAILPGGDFLNPGWIMSLLLLHFLRNRRQKGVVIKTISNSSLIEKIAEKHKVKLFETPVGFKHIAELMKTEDVLIGGEESGGIGFKGYIPERDGLLSGLLLLEMMAKMNKSIKEIKRDVENEFGNFCFRRKDIYYPEEKKPKLFKMLLRETFKEILGFEVVCKKDIDGVKYILKDGSWIIFRLSGTEPILRIYAESSSLRKTENLLKFGENFALAVK